MVWRKPRRRPLWLARPLRARATSLRAPRAQAGRWPRTRAARIAAAHRLDIDRVRHHRMIDDQRPAPVLRHADHHDLVPEQVDAGGAARAAGPELTSRRRSALAQCRRRAISPSATATPSALAARDSPIDFSVSVVATTGAARLRLADALRGEQRALDLHEMHIGRIRDAGILPSPPAPLGHHRDLATGRDARPATPPYARARSRAPALLRLPFASLEHRPVRRHRAFGAARHHEADLRGLLRRHEAREEMRQRHGGEATAEIIDAAIALGLAEHRDDAARIDLAALRSHPRCRRHRPGRSAEIR